MTNTVPTIREMALMQIHALACREYIRENPTPSRKAELREIIMTCEVEYPTLGGFRRDEPSLATLSDELLHDVVQKITNIEYN